MQNFGIEQFLRELFQLKATDVELRLHTVTYSDPGTLRLREIQYRIDAVRHGVPQHAPGSPQRQFFHAPPIDLS